MTDQYQDGKTCIARISESVTISTPHRWPWQRKAAGGNQDLPYGNPERLGAQTH